MIDLMYIAANWLRVFLILFLIVVFGGIFAWCMNQNDTLMNILGAIMLFALAPTALLLIGNSLWPQKKEDKK